MKPDPEEHWRAGIYLRLSKEDETQGRSESIANQQALLQRYAMEQGWEIMDYYIDDGYSGLHFDRPGFQRMLRDIEAGRVNLVLTKDLSRLGRDYIDTGYYLERYFPSRRVRYIALADGIDTFDKRCAQNDMGPFKSVMNDLYAKDISKKVRAVMDAKREAGQFIGAFAPYGYDKDPADKNRLLVDRPAAEVVRGIFSEYLSGDSMAEIARRLNREGILPPSRYKAEIQRLSYANANAAQGLWRAETIRSILGNPTYAGDVAQGKNEKLSYKLKASRKLPREAWTVVADTHEAIVDRESFQIVQRMLESRGGRKRSKPQAHLLSGLVFCGDCGRPMTFCRRSSGQSFVLICSGYSRYGACNRHTTDEIQLEQLVLGRLRNIAQRILPAQLEKSLIQACGKNGAEIWKQEKAQAQSRDRQIGQILKTLYEDRAAQRLEESEFEELVCSYREERKKLRTVLAEEGDESMAKDLPQIKAVHSMLYFEQPDRRLLCQLIDRIAVGDDGTVAISYRFSDPAAEKQNIKPAQAPVRRID